MLKKGEENKTIEELTKAEFAKLDIQYSRTHIGKLMYRASLTPIIITIFLVFYIFSYGLANGYINIMDIGSVLLIGLGISSITKMLYYQSLNSFYRNMNKKK
ncbi:MAG: hypothetical protein IJN90_03130 [Bacilli bacterium]|nr:hypothetical protein [Bacilli bacterium]